MAVIAATGVVILVALLISRAVAVALGLILIGFVAVLAIRGIIWMLRPPDEDDTGQVDRD